MRRYKKFFLLLLLMVAVVSVTMTVALRSQSQGGDRIKSRRKTQQMVEFENKFPVADYESPEPTTPKEKEKRHAKGKKYDKDKSELTVDTISEAVMASSHWATRLPAIPVDRSNTVITGRVLDAQAHLSNNKKRVYSEFTVVIDEVIKNDSSTLLAFGDSIIVDRVGGRVRLPGGKVGLYWVTGQSMPIVGRRYLLFLIHTNQDPDFSILTGYELCDSRICLMDDPGVGHPITASEGEDETSFLSKVRTAIAIP